MKDQIERKLTSETEQNGVDDDYNDHVAPLISPTKPHSIRPKMIKRMSLLGETDDPIEVQFEDISAAAFRIKSGIRRTSCEVSFHC